MEESSKTAQKNEETEFIHQFMEEYYKKFEYYPTVIARDSTVESKEGIGVMNLNILENYFDSFLPYFYRQKVRLTDKCRRRELVELRTIFFFLARRMGYSLTNIGKYMKKDHTTVVYGLKQFRNLYETDEMFRILYYKIVNHIKKDKQDELPTLESTTKMEN